MAYGAMEVARLVVGERAAGGIPVANLELQRLLCLLWADWYRATRTPLFHDRVEVWYHGPVVPDVYFAYRRFAADPIRRVEASTIPEPDASRLSALLRGYSGLSASDLAAATTAPGTPRTLLGGRTALGSRIPETLMADAALRRLPFPVPRLFIPPPP